MFHSAQSPAQVEIPQTSHTIAAVGSVQFFRQLILTLLFIILPLCLVALVTLSILFIQMKAELQGQINQLQTQIASSMGLHPGLTTAPEHAQSVAMARTTDTSLGQPGYSGGVAQNSGEFASLDLESTVDRTTQPVQTPNLLSAKTAYLTFDDGPSPRTTEILDVLDDYQVQATFFVTNLHLKTIQTLPATWLHEDMLSDCIRPRTSMTKSTSLLTVFSPTSLRILL